MNKFPTISSVLEKIHGNLFCWGNLITLFKEFNLKEIFKFKSINRIRLRYVDEFKLENEGDVVNKNFNIEIKLPQDFDILFHDFHFGFVLEDTDEGKIVKRLKGRSKKEERKNVIYYLESDYLGKKEYKIETQDQILTILTDIHDKINNYFIRIIQGKGKIGE